MEAPGGLEALPSIHPPSVVVLSNRDEESPIPSPGSTPPDTPADEAPRQERVTATVFNDADKKLLGLSNQTARKLRSERIQQSAMMKTTAPQKPNLNHARESPFDEAHVTQTKQAQPTATLSNVVSPGMDDAPHDETADELLSPRPNVHLVSPGTESPSVDLPYRQLSYQNTAFIDDVRDSPVTSRSFADSRQKASDSPPPPDEGLMIPMVESPKIGMISLSPRPPTPVSKKGAPALAFFPTQAIAPEDSSPRELVEKAPPSQPSLKKKDAPEDKTSALGTMLQDAAYYSTAAASTFAQASEVVEHLVLGPEDESKAKEEEAVAQRKRRKKLATRAQKSAKDSKSEARESDDDKTMIVSNRKKSDEKPISPPKMMRTANGSQGGGPHVMGLVAPPEMGWWLEKELARRDRQDPLLSGEPPVETAVSGEKLEPVIHEEASDVESGSDQSSVPPPPPPQDTINMKDPLLSTEPTGEEVSADGSGSDESSVPPPPPPPKANEQSLLMESASAKPSKSPERGLFFLRKKSRKKKLPPNSKKANSSNLRSLLGQASGSKMEIEESPSRSSKTRSLRQAQTPESSVKSRRTNASNQHSQGKSGLPVAVVITSSRSEDAYDQVDTEGTWDVAPKPQPAKPATKASRYMGAYRQKSPFERGREKVLRAASARAARDLQTRQPAILIRVRAAILIQKHWRRFHQEIQVYLMIVEQDAATLLQRVWRRYFYRREYLQQKSASCVIQARSRGLIARKRWEQMACAAIAIQRVWKAYWSQLQFQAAVLVQASWRRFSATLQYQADMRDIITVQSIARKRAAVRESRHSINAVILLQRSWRCHHHQRIYLQQKSAAALLQQSWRCYHYQRIYQRQKSAASLLQRDWRHYYSRRVYQAACVLQTKYRGFLARKRWDQIVRSSVIVQKVVRGFLAKLHHQLCLADIVVAQSIIRRRASILARKDRMHAIRLLQRSWRCSYHRRVYLEQKSAAVAFQRDWRCYHYHRMYKILLQDVVVVQSIVRRRAAICANKDSMNAVRLLQRSWQCHYYRRIYLEQKLAACTIQTNFRSFVVRKRWQQMACASVLVQKVCRGFLAKFQYQRDLKDVVAVQSVARRRSALREIQQKREAVKFLQQVVAVQSVARRRSALREIQQKREAVKFLQQVVAVQSVARRRSALREIQQKRDAVQLLQRVYRRFLFAVQDERSRRIAAAVVCQRAVRRHQATRQHIGTDVASTDIDKNNAIDSPASTGVPVEAGTNIDQALDDVRGVPKGDVVLSLLNDVSQRQTKIKGDSQVSRAVMQMRALRNKQNDFDRLAIASGVSVLSGTATRGPVNQASSLDSGGVCLKQLEEKAKEHLKNDKLEEALEVYNDILSACEGIFVELSSDSASMDFRHYVGTAFYNIGIIHFLRGDYKEALSFFQQASENRKVDIDGTHMELMTSRTKIGLCFYALGQFEEARVELEKVLRQCMKRPLELVDAADYMQLAEVMNNLGCLSFMRGELQQALRLFKNSLDMQQNVLGQSLYKHIKPRQAAYETNLKIAITNGNVGYVQLVCNDFSEAIKSFETALTLQLLVMDDTHVTVVATMEHLVVANFLGGKKKNALALLNTIVDVQVAVYGPSDERVFSSRRSLKLATEEEAEFVKEVLDFVRAPSARRKVRSRKPEKSSEPSKSVMAPGRGGMPPRTPTKHESPQDPRDSSKKAPSLASDQSIAQKQTPPGKPSGTGKQIVPAVTDQSLSQQTSNAKKRGFRMSMRRKSKSAQGNSVNEDVSLCDSVASEYIEI